jgi:hypothetical protein
MQPGDLERLADVRLRALPPPRAPETLLPRVMAVVAAWASRPWYQRAWFTWPVAGQLAAVAGLAVVSAAILALLPGLAVPLGTVVGGIAPGGQEYVMETAGQLRIAAEAAVVLARVVVLPVLSYAFVLVVLMWFACAVFGLALTYAVTGRVSQG